ncbi:hypothetical protein BJF77_07620 [Kocuria sp. CNJ-770]|uniref:DUF2254 domain-containing protein n=3 Tax=Kocuria TaxID=57493 RepID=A0ABV9TMJ9_9MICC|nr:MULTISPECIES: DUF2254 domain-containing protein [Kocuria]OLT10810.1 hypothetical protein BJF77_07620 [Kocuria sp. CNJ-770]
MEKLSGSWRRVFNKFWFVPAVCVVAAVVLAQSVVAVDRWLPETLDSPWISWLYAVGIDGSRGMLSAIGGSMLAVAATAFSITISVVATASSTYGPRLVRNFMADRGNQVVLGVLVSTFIYALLVLRTIRSASDDLAQPFVPHLAVNLAVLLAVADVALVVYFIHHIADSVQVDTLVHGVRRRLLAVIERWHPEEPPEELIRTAGGRSGGGRVRADAVGYLVSVNFERLRSHADEQDVFVELVPRVGDHVLPEEPLFRVRPEHRAEELAERLRHCVVLGDSRSADQDVRFAEQQVVELAVRALSPSTNDPYTAVNAIEEVAAGIVTAVSRPLPGNTVVVDGVHRLRYGVVGLDEIVDMPFDQIRPHATGHVSVLLALVDLAARIGSATVHPSVERQVHEHVDVLLGQFRDSGPNPRDLARVEHHVAARLGG